MRTATVMAPASKAMPKSQQQAFLEFDCSSDWTENFAFIFTKLCFPAAASLLRRLVDVHLLPSQALLVLVDRHEVLGVLLLSFLTNLALPHLCVCNCVFVLAYVYLYLYFEF